MLHKVCSQHIYKIFYATEDSKYTYEVIVERSPNYVDSSISVVKGCTVHVEIVEHKTRFKRNFDYFSKNFNRKEMLKLSQKYFNQYGLIPNPRLKFFNDEM